MHKHIIQATLVALGLVISSFAAGSGPGTPKYVPLIFSTSADLKTQELRISGHHFGSRMPTVKLGNQVMAVKNSSPTHVVVALPQLSPGTYRLTITASLPHSMTSEPFPAVVLPSVN